MKVLISTTHPDNLGGVAYFYRVIRPYLDSDMEYFVIGRRASERHWLQSVIRVCRDYISFVRRVVSGRHEIVHLNPSLGHLSLVRDSMFLVLAKLLRRKVIVFVHGWDVNVERQVHGVLKPLVSIGLLRANAIIVLGREFENKIRGFGYKGPIRKQTTAVSDDVLAIADVRDFNPQKPLTFLFLGRIEKDKGIYEAINAYRGYVEDGGNGTLIIAGDGTELASVRQYVRNGEIKGVKIVGYLKGENKLEALLSADVMLLPTYHEGMPSALLEALGSGLAVICRPVGGTSDFFEDGVMGYCTYSKDPRIFAEFMKRLDRNREMVKEISKFNSRFARKHFAAEKVASRLKCIYREVLSGTSLSDSNWDCEN